MTLNYYKVYHCEFIVAKDEDDAFQLFCENNQEEPDWQIERVEDSELDPHMLARLNELREDQDTYGCHICEKRFPFYEGVAWISTEIGVCHDCYEKLRVNKVCRRCGNTVFKSDVKGYPYVCYQCDENMYEFEVE